MLVVVVVVARRRKLRLEAMVSAAFGSSSAASIGRRCGRLVWERLEREGLDLEEIQMGRER